MENNFYTDDFENFLKDTADNFRMYPSKKVWHSLYNDLHPSRRWPSLAVCLILISAILYIGITNNNSIDNIARTKTSENILAKTKNYNNTIGLSPSKEITDLQSSKSEAENSLNFANDNVLAPAPDQQAINSQNNKTFNTTIGFTQASKEQDTPDKTISSLIIPSNNTLSTKETITSFNVLAPERITTPINLEVNNKDEHPESNASLRKSIVNAKLIASDKAEVTATNIDRPWLEDYAFHNKPSASKWKKNASFLYYITPSVGFRKLYQNAAVPQNSLAANSGLVVINAATSQPLKDKITQSAAINLETGGAVLYNISKRIRLKSGLQFNYTSYNVNANELQHPTQTNLLLNDVNSGFTILSPRISFYANSTSDENKKKLKNNTLQLSIPIGVDYKLAGKNNLKWYAGGSVQPSYITGGHLYALSADEKNYIEDPSLLRKWNLNASLETFLSYKTPSGIQINVGPQLRYQFLSTYDKRFTYTEKLYNFGLKLGMSTNF